MDFGRVYDRVSGFLDGAGFPYAVIGGVALSAYGNPRMTLDLDMVTHADAQGPLVTFLESLGYATLHRSTGYSNHRHAESGFGRVDLVYVRGETATRLFAGVRKVVGPGGRSMPAPRPEHLIAMKVHAMKSAPERGWQDVADIDYLVRLDGVDRDEVRGYFERAGLEDRWHDIERSL